MGTNPSQFKCADLPVHSVSWVDCQEFCRKAGLKLPTEAQWEYACRAETTGPHGGTGKLEDMAWLDENSQGKAHPVGQKQPNGFGLHDMQGNVWEWCEDVSKEIFFSTLPAAGVDPVRSSGSEFRVARGGSWVDVASDCRSSNRAGTYPFIRSSRNGFRAAFWPLP